MRSRIWLLVFAQTKLAIARYDVSALHEIDTESHNSSSLVTLLNASTFDVFVARDELTLVNFYLPRHGIDIGKQTQDVADVLGPRGVRLASFACVPSMEEEEICLRFRGWSEHSRLLAFHRGVALPDKIPHLEDLPAVVKAVTSFFDTEEAVQLTNADHTEFVAQTGVVVVAYLPPSPMTSMFERVVRDAAAAPRRQIHFGICSDSTVLEYLDIKAPTVSVYRSFMLADKSRIDFTRPFFTSNQLLTFIRTNSKPLVDQLLEPTYSSYLGSELPLAYVAIDASHSGLINALRPAAEQLSGRVNFVWIDAVRFYHSSIISKLLLEKHPYLIIRKDERNYILDNQPLDAETITRFAVEVLEKKVAPRIRSQDRPKKQNGSVFKLVGSQFDEVVYDDSKDVFVIFTEILGHHYSQALVRTWNQLGDKYVEAKGRITIARMDTNFNDAPGVRISTGRHNFATLMFKRAGTRELVRYEGRWTLEALVEFVEQNAGNNLHAVPEVEVAQEGMSPQAPLSFPSPM